MRKIKETAILIGISAAFFLSACGGREDQDGKTEEETDVLSIVPGTTSSETVNPQDESVTGDATEKGEVILAEYDGIYDYWKTDSDTGEVDVSYTGRMPLDDGYIFMKDGHIARGMFEVVTGDNGERYYVEDGYVNSDYTGLASDKEGTWYFEGGRVIYDKTGYVEYNGFTYYIENGRSADHGDSFYGVRNGRRTYLIGDSRTRQAYSCVYGDDDWKERTHVDYEYRGLEIWKALGSTKYQYMADALEEISGVVDNVTDVIVLSGFNDIYNEPVGVHNLEKKYCDHLNKRAGEFSQSGTKMYYVSINPAAGDLQRNDGTLYNAKIEDWNEYMRENLDPEVIRFIDTYDNIQLSDRTYDGVHYEKEANIDIINYVMDNKEWF